MYFIIYFVILLNSIAIESSFRCDYTYNKTLDAWFKISLVSASWHDAQLRCALEGATLACPNEMCKSFLQIRPSTEYWSGIHATFSKGDYHTIEGTPISQLSMDWGIEKLNENNTEQCILIESANRMVTRSCETSHPFVCIHHGNKNYKFDECGTHDTEYHYYEKTGKCYKFHTVPRNFSRAYFTCSAEGGHLAIINSEDEHTALLDLFNRYPKEKSIGVHRKDLAYIGFHAWGNWFDWRTIHDQTLEEAGYSTFSIGEPNYYLKGEEYCGSMFRKGKLNDYVCHVPLSFICEKSPAFPGICNEDESEN